MKSAIWPWVFRDQENGLDATENLRPQETRLCRILVEERRKWYLVQNKSCTPAEKARNLCNQPFLQKLIRLPLTISSTLKKKIATLILLFFFPSGGYCFGCQKQISTLFLKAEPTSKSFLMCPTKTLKRLFPAFDATFTSVHSFFSLLSVFVMKKGLFLNEPSSFTN